jgi:hypothetical protein
VQELHADDLLQPPDLLAQRRLGHEDPLRGLGEAARIGERDKVAKMPQLDAMGVLPRSRWARLWQAWP